MAGEWDDERLIQMIRSGNERLINDAAKEIFLKGGGFVALVVRKKGGTEEDQQDVLDDATLELVQKVQNNYYLAEKTGLEPYFRIIVRSRWKDKLRKKYRHNDHEALPGEDFFSSQHKDEKPIDEQLSDSESAEKMARMLEKLSPECRELLKKHWYDRVPINVLAQQLNTTEDALKQRHARCKEKLKKLLGRDPRES
jgi:RNA polymerase sigma factor (sigma-70 family)